MSHLHWHRGDGRRIVSASSDGTLKVWDAETGHELFTFEGHTSSVTSCAYLPDGRRIVSASWKTLKVWDAETGHELFTFEGHTSSVTSCAYSPDGRRIVSASADETLKVWDTETGHEFFTLEGHTNSVESCAYSPDGRRIVSCQRLSSLPVGIGNAYSLDGRRIPASQDNTLKVWDAETGQVLFTRNGQIYSCAYSSDGRRIVSASWDHTLKVWDAESGQELSCFYGVYDMSAVACTAGSVTAGDVQGTVYILKLPVGEEKEPYVTPLRLYRFVRTAWDDHLTANCKWCGKRFEPANKIIDVIKGLNSHLSPDQSPAASLPPDAWDNPRLLSDCPNCHKPLKFNPFIVDNLQKKPWWKFWGR